MKEYLDKQSFAVLCLFVFRNVYHAKLAVIMMIGRFSPDSGNRK